MHKVGLHWHIYGFLITMIICGALMKIRTWKV